MSLWNATSAQMGLFLTKHSSLPAEFYTISSLILAIAAVLFSHSEAYITAIFLFLVSSLFDLFDGSVARAQNKASSLGAFVDGTTDRFVDFAILYSYFFFKIDTPYLDMGQMVCIASFVVMMPSFVVAYANHRKAVNDDDETLIWRLMNRGEMVFLMMSILAVSLFSPSWAGYLLFLLIVLGSVTVIQTISATIYYAIKGNGVSKSSSSTQ